MYVTRVRLTDIRGFSGSRAVDLRLPGRGGWIVLAGRNGSGKSALLQTVALALCGPQTALALNAGVAGMVSREASSGQAVVDVQVDAEADEFTGLERDGDLPRELRLGLMWKALPARPRGPGHRPTSMLTPGLSDAEAVESGPWSPAASGWFCAGYGPFRRLSGGLSGGYARDDLVASHLATLFHEDAALGESVGWVIDLHHRSLEERTDDASTDPGPAARLLDIVLNLLSDGLMPNELQVNGVSADGLWVSTSDDDVGFALRAMSDGYRTVAALVLDIARHIHEAYGQLDVQQDEDGRVTVLQPGVVLIDEVENHLHVSWQQRIGHWLRAHFPNIQFIVTSHSPYICQAADEDALIRLPGWDENEPPAVVDKDLYRRVVFGSADDAVLSELFGLDTLYSGRAEEHRRRLVELERKVYAATASEAEVAEYRELSRLLTSSVQSRVAEVAARLEPEPER
ncbi:AAA family ATPase [Streptomyces sp. NBC_01451]|uniref:AAA family ATPase n=1 Tax=Streptomyces sp. NBC_01451 TaxID=2903872 RepID=UPI002E31DB3B|nr:AAA family ATPase [Streptomyces sp. NBC_01451]